MSQDSRPAVGTSDASGNLTITFPPAGTNTEITGVVSIPTAPNAAIYTIEVNGQAQGTNGGSGQYGAIQLNNTDVLSLVGTGFLPNTQYTAIIVGRVDYGTIGPVIPTPTASTLTAFLVGEIATQPMAPALLASGTGLTSGTLVDINPASSTRTLVFQVFGSMLAAGSGLVVTGLDSGVTWYDQAIYLGGGGNYGMAVVPVIPEIDPSGYSFEVSSGGPYDYSIYEDTAIYDEALFYNGPTQVADATLAATGNTTITTGPLRLLSIDVDLEPATSSVATVQIGSGNRILRVAASGTTPAGRSLVFPNKGLIVPPGVILQGTFVSGTGNVFFSAVITYP